MPRLGAVLGAVLADLARARAIGDYLSRDLVDQYREDPLLASMSVPRLVMDQVELTLHFSISDVDEAPLAPPDASFVADQWSRHVADSVLPDILRRYGLSAEERAEVVNRVAGRPEAPTVRPNVETIRRALAGESRGAGKAVADAILAGWSDVPREIRSRLGTKVQFRKELETTLVSDVDHFLKRPWNFEFVKAALASQVNVGVRVDELSQASEQLQELRLTLRGEDLSLVIEASEQET